MERTIIFTMCFLSLCAPLFAIDEDTYIHFAVDSYIAIHQLKGNPQALELWAEQIQKKYPNCGNQDWLLFEERITKDNALKNRIYNAVLEQIKAQGYNARIVGLSSGNTTIEIER